ncbi:MAG: c-type cytochrome domain-containing protein [Opitutus sp.]
MKFFLAALLTATSASTAFSAEPALFEARVAPILEEHCVECHGPEKHKGKLRLDSFEALIVGGESDEVVTAGDPKASELFRRITLPETDEDVMPSDGKPHLSSNEIKVIELWIAGGASPTKRVGEFAGLPPPKAPKPPYVPLTPDWRPHAAELTALANSLHVRLVPRSRIATDGLVLRTASAPGRCDDAVLAKLARFAPFIAEAELARTKVTDEGVAILGTFENLVSVDLTRTKVTAKGLAALAQSKKLQSVNLTNTAVDDAAVAPLRAAHSIKRLWLFGTKATAFEAPVTAVAGEL